MKAKNNILFILSLIAPLFIFGQLSVRNNAYLYASDVVLFVTDDVNIEETTANIYLRNEAQLLQGSGTTGNSGIGKLSVYQSGTVNEYAYNYWASPVGNVSADNNANRSFIPNQQFHDVITAPITSNLASFTAGYNGSSSPLTISSRWLYSFSPGTVYAEWDYLGDTGNLTTGYGFTMKGTSGSGDNQLYDFRGKPNSGTVQASVLVGELTLVGNPYPSALDALEFIHDPVNTNVMTGTLHYWEQAPAAASHYLVDYVGGYATYTISFPAAVDSFTPATFIAYTAAGVPIPSPTYGTGTRIARRFIPIAQGFMVEGASSGNITFSNSHRAFYQQSGGDSFFFRGATATNNSNTTNTTEYNEYGFNIVPDDFKRFRLNIDFDMTYTRQLLMNFHNTATDGFDYGLEGIATDTLDSDAYWTTDEEAYFIQAFDFDPTLTIPLVVVSENEQTINFRIFDVQNFDASQPIFIYDIEENLYIDLRDDGVYSINLPTGTYTDRFQIVFENATTLAIDDTTFENFNIFQNNSNSELVIVNPNSLDLKSVTLYDMLGKEMFRKRNLEDNNRYVFSTKNLSEGIYIAKVETVNSKVFSEKVIVSND